LFIQHRIPILINPITLGLRLPDHLIGVPGPRPLVPIHRRQHSSFKVYYSASGQSSHWQHGTQSLALFEAMIILERNLRRIQLILLSVLLSFTFLITLLRYSFGLGCRAFHDARILQGLLLSAWFIFSPTFPRIGADGHFFSFAITLLRAWKTLKPRYEFLTTYTQWQSGCSTRSSRLE